MYIPWLKIINIYTVLLLIFHHKVTKKFSGMVTNQPKHPATLEEENNSVKCQCILLPSFPSDPQDNSGPSQDLRAEASLKDFRKLSHLKAEGRMSHMGGGSKALCPVATQILGKMGTKVRQDPLGWSRRGKRMTFYCLPTVWKKTRGSTLPTYIIRFHPSNGFRW